MRERVEGVESGEIGRSYIIEDYVIYGKEFGCYFNMMGRYLKVVSCEVLLLD